MSTAHYFDTIKLLKYRCFAVFLVLCLINLPYMPTRKVMMIDITGSRFQHNRLSLIEIV